MITNKKMTKKVEKREVKRRLTKQRQLIWDFLMSVKSHPTAEMVHKSVKKKLPNISLGTVYRNLQYLADNGYILRLGSDKDEFFHYDADISNHDHFICDHCHQIIDLQKKKVQRLPKLSIGKTLKQSIFYYGLCNKCLKIKKK